MPKKRFYSGVIDPVTIVGVLFLIITAGVGTYVVRNRNINLDINERASCSNTCLQSDFPELCGCTSDNIDDAPAGSGGISIRDIKNNDEEEEEENNNTSSPVVPNVTPPTGGSCTQLCLQNATPDECGCNGTTPAGIILPPSGQTGSNSSTYNDGIQGNDYINTPNDPNFQDNSNSQNAGAGCDLNGNEIPENITVVFSSGANDYRKCVAGVWSTDCNQSQNGVQACTLGDVSSGAVPTYLLAQYNQEIQRLSNECTAGGGVWLGSQCGTIEQSIQVYDIDPRFREDATNLVTQIKDSSGNTVYEVAEAVTQHQTLLQGRGQQALYTTIKDREGNVISRDMAILQYQNSLNVEKTDDGFIRNFTTIVRDQNTKQILNALTQSINTKDLAQVTEPSQSYYFADCSREGLTPEQTAECNRKLTQAYNAPIIGRYLQAYSPQEVQYTGDQFLGYNLYNPTKEQFTSSVALGSAMTAGAAVITAGGGLATGGYTLLTAGGSQALLAAGATTISQSIGLGLAGFQTYQLGSTVDTCVSDGLTDNCKTNIGFTLVGYAAMGSSAIQQAYQGAKWAQNLNTGINLANIVFDAADISQSCGSGEYASSFGCGAAIVGTIFDVGQAGSDFGLIEAIAKNINFSNVANNPLAEVNFQSPNQLQLGAPDVNMPKDINPNSVIDAVQGPNGTFVVPNTSTTTLAVAPHLDIAQADDVITATILNEIPATRPQDSLQEIAGLLMAPEQPINVTKDFTEIEMQKVPVEIGDEKLNIPQAENKGFAGIIDEILNPPLAAFKPDIRWLMNLEPPKFIANIGDWVNRNIGDNPIINRIIGKPEDISLSLRPDEAEIPKIVKVINDSHPELKDSQCSELMCGWISDEVEGLAKFKNFEAKQYQVVDLNKSRGLDDFKINSFRHTITIVDDGRNRYLVDLTFSQFIDESGNVRHPISNISSGYNKTNPIVKKLLENGYIKLDDKSLNEYLDILSAKEVTKPTAGLNILDETPARVNNVPAYTSDQVERFFPKLLSKVDISPTSGVWDGVKSWWDESILNWRNRGGGGSPAGDITDNSFRLNPTTTISIDNTVAKIKGAQADVSVGYMKIEGQPNDTKVAVKELRTPAGEDADFIKALNESEVNILNTTQSSVKPKYYGMVDNKIILEYIEGQNLNDYLRNASYEQKIEIYEKIKAALQKLHSDTGLPHGDLNVVNIYNLQYVNVKITPNGEIIFLDQVGTVQYKEFAEDRNLTPTTNLDEQIKLLQDAEIEILNNQIYGNKLDAIGGRWLDQQGFINTAIESYFPIGTSRYEPKFGDILINYSKPEDIDDMLLVVVNRIEKKVTIYIHPDVEMNEIDNKILEKIKTIFNDMDIDSPNPNLSNILKGDLVSNNINIKLLNTPAIQKQATLLGESKTTLFKTGKETILKPGDIIERGPFKYTIPNPDDYPGGVYYNLLYPGQNMSDTYMRLDNNGILLDPQSGTDMVTITFYSKPDYKFSMLISDGNGNVSNTIDLSVQHNTKIIRGNPEPGIIWPIRDSSGFFPGFKNWWNGLKQSDNKIIQFFISPKERGSLAISLPYAPKDIDVRFNENAVIDISGTNTAKGFLDNEGNLNFGVQPSFTNIEYYPVTVRKVGSEYQILPTFDVGRAIQGDSFYDATVSSNHGQILLQPDGTMKYRDTGSLNGSFYRNPQDGEFIRISLGEEIVVTSNTEIRLGGDDGNIIRVNNNTDTGKIEIVNTTTKNYASYNKPPILDISRTDIDDSNTIQEITNSKDTPPKQINTPDPIYYKFESENKLISDNGGKYKIYITEDITTGGEGKIELGAIENTATGNSIEVIIKHALSPEDGQKMVNQYLLFSKIEKILEAEGRPDLKSRIVIPLGIIQDTNGNATGYIRSYTRGRPIWEGHGKVNGMMTDTDILDFEGLFKILDKYGLSPYDISPQNFIGSPGKYVLTDITPEENVALRKDGTRQQIGHFIDKQVINTGYIQRRLKEGDEIIPDPTSGQFFYDTHSSDSALENFRLMVKYQDEGFVRSTVKPQGQTLVEFGTIMPAVLAVPTVGLYYFDEYFDLGILDRIKAALSDNPTAKSLGAALDSGNFPILKPLAPILPLPNTNFENINYIPDLYIEPTEAETEVKPEGLTVNKANEDTSCTRIDRSNPCDGERIYQTYLEYKEQFGEITPAEFLAIILMAEASGADPEFLKSITLATSSQLWGSSADHEAYCKTPSCEEGIFNFIGAYTEAGARRYNTILFESDPEKIKQLFNLDQSTIDYYKNNGITVEKIANDTIYDPISTVYTNDTPTQWGNFGCGEKCEYLGSNWIKEANQTDINTGTTDRCGLYDIVGQEDSLAVVFTDNQKYNWSTKNPDCFKN